MRLIEVNVLKEWIENWFTKNRFYHPYAKNNNIPITELYDILEQMPSAQPEQDEWCTDCKEYDSEKHCCHRWTKVIRNTVNELSAAWQWTPVEDSPKRSGWYIVTKRFGNGETWIGTKWYSTAYGWNGDGILAWMKLPEAYKEGE